MQSLTTWQHRCAALFLSNNSIEQPLRIPDCSSCRNLTPPLIAAYAQNTVAPSPMESKRASGTTSQNILLAFWSVPEQQGWPAGLCLRPGSGRPCECCSSLFVGTEKCLFLLRPFSWYFLLSPEGWACSVRAEISVLTMHWGTGGLCASLVCVWAFL